MSLDIYIYGGICILPNVVNTAIDAKRFLAEQCLNGGKQSKKKKRGGKKRVKKIIKIKKPTFMWLLSDFYPVHSNNKSFSHKQNIILTSKEPALLWPHVSHQSSRHFAILLASTFY